MKQSLLVVEDDENIRFALRKFFEKSGYEVLEAPSVEAAKAVYVSHYPSLVIADYSLPDGNALELLATLKSLDAGLPVIILTGQGTIDLAVQAIKQGADQFVTKPVDLPSLLQMVRRLSENRSGRQRQAAQETKEIRFGNNPFLGTSPAIRRLRDEAAETLQSLSPVLIQGETGSGKGILAKWLHRNSDRASEAFVDINCAGLSKDLLESELFGYERGAFTGAVTAKAGLIETAHRGTFFLDEVGDMDPAVQPKLLKIIEDKRFRRLGDTREKVADVRLLLATHSDLQKQVAENRFRADLYYRISTFTLRMPALRDRREDIPALVESIGGQLSYQMGRKPLTIGAGALEALASYSWPGNVRELHNVLERAILRTPEGSSILAGSFADLVAGRPVPNHANGLVTLEALESQHIGKVLAHTEGDIPKAAVILGISKSSLYTKVKQFGLGGKRPER